MSMYDINELDKYFTDNKIAVSIFSPTKFNMNKHWSVSIEKSDDGVDIKVYSTHPCLLDAMFDVYEKFNRVAKNGAPNLLAPVIEHKPMTLDEHETKQEKAIDDDIPF